MSGAKVQGVDEVLGVRGGRPSGIEQSRQHGRVMKPLFSCNKLRLMLAICAIRDSSLLDSSRIAAVSHRNLIIIMSYLRYR